MFRLPLTRGGLLHLANKEAWRRTRARWTALVPELLQHNKRETCVLKRAGGVGEGGACLGICWAIG